MLCCLVTIDSIAWKDRRHMPTPRSPILPWMRLRRTAGKLATPFHLRVREERLARQLSLRQVAKAAGMDKQTVLALETHHARPTIDHVVRLAVALGVADWYTLVVMDEPEEQIGAMP